MIISFRGIGSNLKDVGVWSWHLLLRLISGIFPFHTKAYEAQARPIRALHQATETAILTATSKTATAAEKEEADRYAGDTAEKLQAATQSQLNFIAVTVRYAAHWCCSPKGRWSLNFTGRFSCRRGGLRLHLARYD